MAPVPLIWIFGGLTSAFSHLAAPLCEALPPWHRERNVSAAALGPVAAIAQLLLHDDKWAVGFLKAGLTTLLVICRSNQCG